MSIEAGSRHSNPMSDARTPRARQGTRLSPLGTRDGPPVDDFSPRTDENTMEGNGWDGCSFHDAPQENSDEDVDFFITVFSLATVFQPATLSKR